MIKIILEPADNGVIKRIEDDNINGAGETANYSVVYELENDVDSSFERTRTFLYEILEDLGLDVGNKYKDKVLEIGVSWGSKYEPNLPKLQEKITELEEQLILLKELEKNMKGEV